MQQWEAAEIKGQLRTGKQTLGLLFGCMKGGSRGGHTLRAKPRMKN